MKYLPAIGVAVGCSVALCAVGKALQTFFKEDPTAAWVVMSIAASGVIFIAILVSRKILKF
jgi:hypothetical protein